MRVGLLVEYLGPRGGTEEYVRALSEQLSANGHQIDLLFESCTNGDATDWLSSAGRLTATPVPGDPATRRRWLAAYLKSAKPDVLYLQNISFSSDVVAVASGAVPVARYIHDFRPVCLRTSKVLPLSHRNCKRALGIGCLLHACSIGPTRYQRLPFSWNHLDRKLSERSACLRMDRIFVASTFMRDLMLHNGFAPDKVRLLPYFCPMPGNTATQALQPGSRLLFVGQLQRYKGLSVLLAAMKRLPHSVTLDVAGDGPRLREYQGRCSDWGLQGRVAFHGWLNRDAVSQLMQEVQVVVVPSIWNEPFGIVGLEAMFHGRPVVAFDVGGIREWLVDQETGVLVPDLNEQSLSVAIAELLGNLPRAEAMGRNGARRVRERFTAASHITRLLGDFTAISQSAQYGPTT